MTEKVEGIVLKELNYGETSKILTVFTKEYGVIGILSKGCRSVKSELCSLSAKLTYGYFNIYYKEDKLSTLKSIDLINSFKEIRKDIILISYASFILELSEQVYKESNDISLFDLLAGSLIKINEGLDAIVITNILELKYLTFLGVEPVIDSCAVCGSDKGIKTLSVSKGGYICNECYQSGTIYDPKTIKMLRMFYYVDIAKIDNINISEKVKHEINHYLNDYYDQYTGMYLKSKNFLKELTKLDSNIDKKTAI